MTTYTSEVRAKYERHSHRRSSRVDPVAVDVVTDGHRSFSDDEQQSCLCFDLSPSGLGAAALVCV